MFTYCLTYNISSILTTTLTITTINSIPTSTPSTVIVLVLYEVTVETFKT